MKRPLEKMCQWTTNSRLSETCHGPERTSTSVGQQPRWLQLDFPKRPPSAFFCLPNRESWYLKPLPQAAGLFRWLAGQSWVPNRPMMDLLCLVNCTQSWIFVKHHDLVMSPCTFCHRTIWALESRVYIEKWHTLHFSDIIIQMCFFLYSEPKMCFYFLLKLPWERYEHISGFIYHFSLWWNDVYITTGAHTIVRPQFLKYYFMCLMCVSHMYNKIKNILLLMLAQQFQCISCFYSKQRQKWYWKMTLAWIFVWKCTCIPVIQMLFE